MMNREVLKYELAKLVISDEGEILTDVLETYFDLCCKKNLQDQVDQALDLIVEKVLELAVSHDEK